MSTAPTSIPPVAAARPRANRASKALSILAIVFALAAFAAPLFGAIFGLLLAGLAYLLGAPTSGDLGMRIGQLMLQLAQPAAGIGVALLIIGFVLAVVAIFPAPRARALLISAWVLVVVTAFALGIFYLTVAVFGS